VDSLWTLTSIVDSRDQLGFTVDSDIQRGLGRPTWIHRGFTVDSDIHRGL